MSGTVVVGLDGSRASAEALTWARDFARVTHRRTRVLHAWRDDAATIYTPVAELRHEQELAARAAAESWLVAVPPDVSAPWNLEVVEGSAGPKLVAAAAQEDDCVLVVGTHEHRGLGRVLHGSISHFVLSHADCPVVAVPPPRPELVTVHADPSTLVTEVPDVPRF